MNENNNIRGLNMIKEFTIESIDIPQYKVDYLKSKIEKLNRKAVKLGCEPMVLSFDNEHTVSVNQHPVTGHRLVIPIIIEMVTATLSYVIPNIDGYQLIARLDIFSDKENEGVVLVSPVPDREVPEKYLNATSIQCDHCGHKRYRTHSILIRHTESGEYKEVGSTCVKDFFNGNDPSGFMFMASIKFHGIVGELKDEDIIGGMGFYNAPWTYEIETVLSYAAASIAKWGFLSKSKADIYGGQTTADHVMDNLNPRPKMKSKEFVTITDEDKKLALETIEYFEKINPETNNYLVNCCKLVKMGRVPYKYMGYAVSMISAYQRAMSEIKASENSTSKHIGVIGERLKDIKVTITSKREFDSDFGIKTLYMFVDESGNIFKTFYTGTKWNYSVDNVISITGTVKKHDQFKGIKQTLLTRVNVY